MGGTGNGSTKRANDVGLISGTFGDANVGALVRAAIGIVIGGGVNARAMRQRSANAAAPTHPPAPRRNPRRVIAMCVRPRQTSPSKKHRGAEALA
jgi:hypothetical protein